MPRYKLRTLLIVLALGPPILAGAWLGPVVAKVSGRFDLNVRFLNDTGNPISQIEISVLDTRSNADMVIALPRNEPGIWKRVVLDEDSSAKVMVNSSWDKSWSGHVSNYWRDAAIAVKAKFVDGTQILFVADIPKARSVRELEVRVPYPSQ